MSEEYKYPPRMEWADKIRELETENRRFRKVLEMLYKPAKIAVNQIICMGGAEYCQPCQNREELAIALEEVELVFDENNCEN